MEELLKKLKVLELYFSLIKKKKIFLNNNEAPKCQIALVVKDCKVMKANSKSTDNIFYSPKPPQQNGLQQCLNGVKQWLNQQTEKADMHVQWWTEIEKHHVLLPFDAIEPFYMNKATGEPFSEIQIKARYSQVENFESKLMHILKDIDIKNKSEMLPFELWKCQYDEYCRKFSNYESFEEASRILIKAVGCKFHPLFELYQQYCLPRLYDNSNINELESKLWQQSEMLYILDDIFSERNRQTHAKDWKALAIVDLKEKFKVCKKKKKKKLNKLEDKF
ncbi:hypothetical protein RFI_24681 [Reticulomyxa filosa]|uniref:Uncharacterized protein n=1 Tax=Reticulomyxa filosa TaxID=46433 RepID=X6MI06_RETFI|nr:hypothetical protein RFI_24681 [Reticulomyxa filosa]|eukprot:ETO12695.1 hypothetical protein RFI_24681 [Reticulomyxa filosa]